MEELGHQNLTSDSLPSALSNGKSSISSFLLVASIHGSVRFGACIHTMRAMAENGVLFDGVESNRGVMASQWYTTTNFHKLYPMVKTASLHSF